MSVQFLYFETASLLLNALAFGFKLKCTENSCQFED